MADWKKLDKELKDALDNMTDEDWDNWKVNQKKNQAVRRKNMKLQMKEHLSKIKSE